MIRISPLRFTVWGAALCATALTACSSRYTEPKSSTAPEPSAEPAPEHPPTPPKSPPKAQETAEIAEVRSAVEATDRSTDDLALDAGRKPIELFSFFGIRSGTRVLELAAGGGYTAELLVRITGPEGEVFGQNSPFMLQRFAEKPWTERLQKPVMARVHRLDQDIDAPLPPEARELDAVLLILFYHDTVWQKANREAMNRAVYDALKPGGVYGIVDHSARPRDGLTVVETLHRIEPFLVRAEVEKAGFVLEKEADFLGNPEDTRDWSASPRVAGERRGTSDRFVYLFRKPISVACAEPRNEMCTREFHPVCATVDTGVRCIQAPCPLARTDRTFPNGCSACADPSVIRHRPGACPEAAP